MMTLQWKKCAVLLGMAAVLAGCATHRVVEGDVRSFSRLPAAATAQQPMTYRLERLPSQQTPSFDPILALAEQALARAGLQRNDDSGQWVVQLGAQAGFTPRRDPFDDHPPWLVWRAWWLGHERPVAGGCTSPAAPARGQHRDARCAHAGGGLRNLGRARRRVGV